MANLSRKPIEIHKSCKGGELFKNTNAGEPFGRYCLGKQMANIVCNTFTVFSMFSNFFVCFENINQYHL